MSIQKTYFGLTKNGEIVDQYTLQDKNGLCVQILTYGATIRSMIVPSKNGVPIDVVLGCDNMRNYQQQDSYLGAAIGRCANRIAAGEFALNGNTYTLVQNNGNNAHHGGIIGFDKQVWQAQVVGDMLVMTLFSQHMQESYPGNLCVKICYRVVGNTLSARLFAFGDEDTVCNLTLHPYFNLNGAGSVLSHRLKLGARQYTPIDTNLIPTGELACVEGTPLNFCREHEVGDALDFDHSQIKLANGMDHNFVCEGEKNATLVGDASGIILEIKSNYPGMQVYSGNFLQLEHMGKDGASYLPHSGIAIEPQGFPNAINQPAFPNCVLKRGEVYRQFIDYCFST